MNAISSLIALVLLTAPVAEDQNWGTLKGRFVYDAPRPEPKAVADESLLVDADRGVKNVLIYLRANDVDVHRSYQDVASDPVHFDFDAKVQFTPRVLTLLVGQHLVIRNLHPTATASVNIVPLGDKSTTSLLAVGAQTERTFDRQQNIPILVTTSIHPRPRAYILPRSNPYMTVSAADRILQKPQRLEQKRAIQLDDSLRRE